MERNAKISMRAIRCFVFLCFKSWITNCIYRNKKKHYGQTAVHGLVSVSCFTDVSKYDCKPSVLKSALYCRSKYPRTTAVQQYLSCTFDYCPARGSPAMGHGSTCLDLWPTWPIQKSDLFDPLPYLTHRPIACSGCQTLSGTGGLCPRRVWSPGWLCIVYRLCFANWT